MQPPYVRPAVAAVQLWMGEERREGVSGEARTEFTLFKGAFGEGRTNIMIFVAMRVSRYQN
jgi:hypothetical protein